MLTTTTTLTTSAMMLRLDRRLRLERPPVLDHPDHHLVCRLVCLDRIKEVCAQHMMIQVYGHALVLQPQSHARTSVIATMIATTMLMKTKHFVQHGPTLVLDRAVPCLDHQSHLQVCLDLPLGRHLARQARCFPWYGLQTDCAAVSNVEWK